MSTTAWIVLAIVVVVAGVGIWYYQANYSSPSNNSAVAGPGEHCGGNMANAPTCGPGYQCEPDPSATLPFGDVGGLCASIQVQSGNGY